MKRAVSVLALASVYGFVSACCGVAPTGQPVKFGDQSNIIVWNPETKMEHFVRNAYFESNAKDFGFIAPTPSVPDLSTAEASAYEHLEHLKPPKSPGCSAPMDGATTAANATTGSVEVLQQVQVGKYDATTIKSEDPAAVSLYLKKNGYASNSDFEEWVSHYAKKGWVFTAFKVRGGKEGSSETGIIRMSFKTDEPFNPYYVPGQNYADYATLKVYFVSDAKYSASVGKSAGWNPSEWNASVPTETVATLASDLKLKESDFPKNPTVTYFEKISWMEGSKEDLFFKKDTNFTPVVLVLVAAGAGLWYLTRRNRMKAVPT